MDLDSSVVECPLPEEMGSIGAARAIASQVMDAWRYRGSREDVLLAVSELVTNALVHGAGGPVLRIAGGPARIRVEVGDSSQEPPEPREPGPCDGWGLRVIDRISTAWGTSAHDGGKVVWCELAAPGFPVTPAESG